MSPQCDGWQRGPDYNMSPCPWQTTLFYLCLDELWPDCGIIGKLQKVTMRPHSRWKLVRAGGKMAPEIWSQSEIEEQWQQLNPIFIMGRQRTGTSIMWRALRTAGFLGFPEGHLWFDLVESLARLRDPEHQKRLRQEIFTLGSGRNLVLEKRFALMVDQFHRGLLPPDLVRWVDKSPGVHPVRLAPMLAELFPRAQFIFMLRNPITTVNSAAHYIPKNVKPTVAINPDAEKPLRVYRAICRHWVRVMELWRQVRPMLADRYIEVAQEHIVENPDKIAALLAEFLGIPQFAQAIGDVFQSRRENTAFPDRDVDDFFYPVDWTDEQKTVLTEVCLDEMTVWGYPLDFQRPGGPDPTHVMGADSEPMDVTAYYQWLEHQNELLYRGELAACKESLARINQGRVMQVLNAMNGLLRRLRLQ